MLFELGAAWGFGRTIYPLLGPGLTIKDLPNPISNLPCIEIEGQEAQTRLRDLIQQLGDDLAIAEKSGGKAQANLESFVAI